MTRAAVWAVAGLLALAGCSGADTSEAAADRSPAPATSSATASPSPSRTSSPAPSPTTSSPAVSHTAPAPTTAPATPARPAVPPATPAARPSTPAAQQPAPTAATLPDLRSPAGNRYRAGQFCKRAHLGMATRDDARRVIHCDRDAGGTPRWHY